jgi:Uma2 family endonuclease
MSAQPEDVRISWEEFLRVQQVWPGPERIAWDDGRIVKAMTGGTERHDLVTMALVGQLLPALAGGPCRVFAHNRQIKTATRSYYPDVLVRRGQAAHPLYEDDARLIIEVLSPGNTPAERTAMLFAYQQPASIEVILFVNTVRRIVTVHRRRPDRSGWVESQVQAEGLIDLGYVILDFGAMWTQVDAEASFD